MLFERSRPTGWSDSAAEQACLLWLKSPLPFQSWDARFISVLTLALVVDKFLLYIDLCLPHVGRKVYTRPEPHATGLTYSQKQRIVGGFHHSHSAGGNDTSRFLENIPLALVQGEFDPQKLAGGFRVLEEVLRSKKLKLTLGATSQRWGFAYVFEKHQSRAAHVITWPKRCARRSQSAGPEK
jgi:hypothetical protein